MKEKLKNIYAKITIKELFVIFLILCGLIATKLTEINHSLSSIQHELFLIAYK
jgi:hypothetical protein